MTSNYKKFIYEMRKMEFETPYIIVLKEHPPLYLKHYVKMVLEVSFDATAYYAYYGELKKNISSLVNFYAICIGSVKKKAEEYSQHSSHNEMMQLMAKTISTHDFSQEEFIKEFQPIESDAEQEKLNTIIANYNTFKEELLNMSEIIANFKKKQNKTDDFMKENCQRSVEKTSQFCDFAYVWIAKLLAERLNYIGISLEDSLQRIQRNVHGLTKEYDHQLSKLYNNMYDLNKETLTIMRRRTRQSKDIAEVRKVIKRVKEKIEKVSNYENIKKLKPEINHWSSKLKEFNQIAKNVNKIKGAINNLTEEEKNYREYKVIELPGPKVIQWENIGELYRKRKIELEEKYTEASRALITFFCCRGSDRILYTDCVGTYYVDDYGHQNYVTDYGSNVYHLDCDGNFVQKLETNKYYFDSYGRYILQDNGDKVHQLAPCTSHYKLGDDQLLHKITQDCGHSTKPNEKCRVQIKDLTDTVLLPKTEPIDIKGTLDTETMEYLWNAFGWILPEVLYEVGKEQSKNPIHLFGHILLTKRYSMTDKEIEAKKMEARNYHQNNLIESREIIEAAIRVWKSKLVKRCKPEDLDTTAQDLAYASHQNEQQFITDVNQFCYDLF